MKSLVVLLALLSSTLAIGNNGNEGPNASVRQPKPLASIESNSGFFGRFRASYVLTITEAGTVYKVQRELLPNDGTRTVRTNYNNISTLRLNQLKRAVAEVRMSPLTEDAGRPRCMDAPTTVYKAYPNDEEVIIAEKSFCIMHALNNGTADKALKVIKKIDEELVEVTPAH